MNFSKEYINECDCPEIQGLFKMTAINRNNDILIGCLKNIKGSLFHNRDEHYYLATSPEKVIWLPTGDQLDEQIAEIFAEWSKDGEDLNYSFSVSFSEGYISSYEAYTNNRDCCRSFLDDNPLIAKIKLLKQLLEAK